ncbi:MAG: methionine gamma-lyase family protein [Ruthenibacterium sp.]
MMSKKASTISEFYDLSPRLLNADDAALTLCAARFAQLEDIKEYNQLKMLRAFTDSHVGGNHLVGTTGYGMGDEGRDKIEQVFAALTGSGAALFRHNFASGTHTLAVALFGVLRPGDTLLAVAGRPYDTLQGVIGLTGEPCGSLREFGVKYAEIDLLPDGTPDYSAIAAQCKTAKMCYIQRSRGYAARPALSLDAMERISKTAKQANPDIIVMVDNCYGEFTQREEPTQRGADLMAGSLIKNPGGGIAPTGGYIAGRADLVELCAHRLTAPGVGGEIGCTLDLLRQLYLGLYYAPGVVCEALKASVYSSCLFEQLGYAATPTFGAQRNDIITSVETGSPEGMIALCGGVQAGSPVDSFATPIADEMPGYEDKVIMAAGAFTMGSSIELSADGPLRPPYTVYMQGGINFHAARAGILLGAENMLKLEEK